MKFNHLEACVHRALDRFYTNDSDLLSLGASEWAIAHRLAVYLESQICGWNIDCEYNKQGINKDPKHNDDDKGIRPDIVIHHRGSLPLRHNLLVIELKKHVNESDQGKACRYTNPPSENRPFQYQFGLALSLLPNPEFHWFSEGQMQS